MTVLSDQALVAELVKCTRDAAARSEQSLTSLMVSREYGLAEAIRATSVFERARNRWGLEIDEALRRSGLYAETLAGTFPLPDSVLSFLNKFAGRERPSFGAFEVYGAVSSGAPVELGCGFRLRRFSRDEVATWNPRVRTEQLDPYPVAEYSFVVSESSRAFLPERPFQLLPARPTVERDPFWTEGWWKPFLLFNLFSSEPVVSGVRMQVTPGWRIQRKGEFEGEFYPSSDPETGEVDGEYWHRFARQHEFEPSRLTAFAAQTMATIAAVEASPEAAPLRVASRSYLRAMRTLPKIGSTRFVDFGELEDCLFDLARTADGLSCGIDDAGRDRRFTFDMRCARLAHDPSHLKFLGRCYSRRTSFAHSFGDDRIEPSEVLLLAKIVRRAFLGYLSVIPTVGCDRARLVGVLKGSSELPAGLQELALSD